MQSIRIRFGCLFSILLLCGVEAGLRECGEFEKDDLDTFPYQNELEQVFDTCNENDTQQTLKLLESIGTGDLDEADLTAYKNNPIKYVVSSHRT